MRITTDELRRMTNQEGLILQGYGGDAQEWIDGINELLTQEGILLEGTKFKNVKSFRNEGLTNLLFPFEKNLQPDCGLAGLRCVGIYTQRAS